MQEATPRLSPMVKVLDNPSTTLVFQHEGAIKQFVKQIFGEKWSCVCLMLAVRWWNVSLAATSATYTNQLALGGSTCLHSHLYGNMYFTNIYLHIYIYFFLIGGGGGDLNRQR